MKNKLVDHPVFSSVNENVWFSVWFPVLNSVWSSIKVSISDPVFNLNYPRNTKHIVNDEKQVN